MIYILIALVIALGAVSLLALTLVYQLIAQNGRTIMRLEALENLLAPLTDHHYGIEPYEPTLPSGVPAPPISLPDLHGVQRTLSEWRGSRILLVFLDPACSFSLQLLPLLVALEDDVVPGRPTPVLVTTGDRETNRTVLNEAGCTYTALLQSGTEAAAAYKVDGTPMAYLVDADGTIAGDIAVGIQSILLLAGEIAVVADETATLKTGSIPQDLLKTETTVRLRDGLKEGATAPMFRLPGLNGEEISLVAYRGKDVVVVFSDPDCVPCDELTPMLEAAHQARTRPALLMISRGEAEDTRAKVEEFGLTFPVALQRHWEISREYGIFATPAAYFIDEWGTIGADVAIGPENIMQLIDSVATGKL